MLRLVFDTNVLVSAAISNGKSRELLEKGLAKHYCVVTSDLILKELATVLRRPKFQTSEDEIHRVILALIRSSDVINVKSKFKAVKEDPKDDIIINTAHDGNADIIVTRDKHLLKIETFRHIKIVTVETALDLL